jgi:hypothetical protein
MNKKLKLAKLILMEFESLKEVSNLEYGLTLAQELTKDAIALAVLIEEEENMNKIIDMITRQPMEEPAYHRSYAMDIMSYIMEYKADKKDEVSFAEHLVLKDLLKSLENNSGVSIQEVLENKKGA